MRQVFAPGDSIALETIRRYEVTPRGVIACGKVYGMKAYCVAIRQSGTATYQLMRGPLATSAEALEAWRAWCASCRECVADPVAEAVREWTA